MDDKSVKVWEHIAGSAHCQEIFCIFDRIHEMTLNEFAFEAAFNRDETSVCYRKINGKSILLTFISAEDKKMFSSAECGAVKYCIFSVHEIYYTEVRCFSAFLKYDHEKGTVEYPDAATVRNSDDHEHKTEGLWSRTLFVNSGPNKLIDLIASHIADDIAAKTALKT